MYIHIQKASQNWNRMARRGNNKTKQNKNSQNKKTRELPVKKLSNIHLNS